MAASLRMFQLHTMSLIQLQGSRSCYLQFSRIQNATNSSVFITNRRYKSRKVPEDRILPPIKVKRFLYNKLVNVITISVDNLEKNMPKTVKVYRTFRSGVSKFTSDFKQFYGITSRLWNGESLSGFTRRELELYRQFSGDLPVVALVFILAFAPGGILVLPLAYMFPRFLLSTHFWTIPQKEEFRRLELTKRFQHYPTILDLMYHNAESGRSDLQVKKAVNKLDSSVILSHKDIVSLKPLFEDRPFSLDAVSLQYRWILSRSIGMPFRRKKLVKDALLIRFTDVAMKREGIHNLTDNDLNRACAWRGLNPDGMERDAKLSYLNKWTDITADVHESSISLLLHLPILLSYCQPSNRKLMGSRHATFRPRL